MYLSCVTIENFRCFGGDSARFELTLEKGLTALVGENDSGKSAVVDALRLALGTMDQEIFPLEDSDFNEDSPRQIKVICKFSDLTETDQRVFLEYLSYGDPPACKPVLYVHYTAQDTEQTIKGRPYRSTLMRSGKAGDGPAFNQDVRRLLNATYLRPLRNAEQALSAGRRSRLSQVLHKTEQIKIGKTYDEHDEDLDISSLNVLGICDLANRLLANQEGILEVRTRIDTQLDKLSFAGPGKDLKSDIKVSGAKASDDNRLRQMLEKLDLIFEGSAKPGLGSSNLLFIACELLLLVQEGEGNKLLLIEEPEAHLHSQRQLRIMKFLQEEAAEKGIQVIVTTHSPNLASAIDLNNIVMLHGGHAFSMKNGCTRLDSADYFFLKRFLDSTKANLFFACGVVIVEGDAENILLPSIATLLGRDFTKYGVSIVNVGGVGLHRYSRIFQRTDEQEAPLFGIPVSCITDMDVMPDCAPFVMKLTDSWPPPNKPIRRWKAKRDHGERLNAIKLEKSQVNAGQSVKVFVSDEWTFEYDLFLGPKASDGSFKCTLAEEVYVAMRLAQYDERIHAGKKTRENVKRMAVKEFEALKSKASPEHGSSSEENLAAAYYAILKRKQISKAVAAQYLAELLAEKYKGQAELLRSALPIYIVEAIEYVTGGEEGNAGTC